MYLIDANVILRYLLADHEEMSAQAKAVIESGAYTTPEVLAEVVYVLSGVYRAERAEVRLWLSCLLDVVSMEHRAAMLHALQIYEETRLDFVDCLFAAYQHVLGRDVFTFDKKLRRLLAEHTGGESS